jgi:hypothetical protein
LYVEFLAINNDFIDQNAFLEIILDVSDCPASFYLL